ncbi:hypothetical protein [Burkholderia sp. Se-20378]|uniref:hypothetical protein n=1 Tax=Burkholderia sp. Se-20378 TaxID=2703899 RepID=UPI00198159D1|nr:hypothetical protein [Burkholderia sp. Se-20378]MBN3774292.1 hypothetical protein [Burkholderia sp. Se-20378]
MIHFAEPAQPRRFSASSVHHGRAATATTPVRTIGKSERRQHRTLPHAYPRLLSNSVIFIHAFDTTTLNPRIDVNQTLFDDINGFADSMASRNPHPPPANPEIIIETFIHSRQL